MTYPSYDIQIIESPSDAIIQKAIEMDHAAFEEPDWITKKDADLIYHNKSDCLIWLTQDDVPMGLATIFALNRNVPAKAVEKNTPVYKLLTQETMTDCQTHILYCHCFLILPEFRGKGWIYRLYEGLGRWLENKGNGYCVLYADAVSKEGQCCLERLNFTPVHSFGDDGELYKGDKQSVISAILKNDKGHENLKGLRPIGGF